MTVAEMITKLRTIGDDTIEVITDGAAIKGFYITVDCVGIITFRNEDDINDTVQNDEFRIVQ